MAKKKRPQFKVFAKRTQPQKPKLQFLVDCFTRKAARHYCKNNYYRIDHNGLVIEHPCGRKEDFSHNGVL